MRQSVVPLLLSVVLGCAQGLHCPLAADFFEGGLNDYAASLGSRCLIRQDGMAGRLPYAEPNTWTTGANKVSAPARISVGPQLSHRASMRINAATPATTRRIHRPLAQANSP